VTFDVEHSEKDVARKRRNMHCCSLLLLLLLKTMTSFDDNLL